mmetsp:Transcript_10992/g.16063  ORF Transcript_10992/g.16063 Transcript_10992/m.16063 type:complete len:108 (+) Transcript_10992:154-477(+)
MIVWMRLQRVCLNLPSFKPFDACGLHRRMIICAVVSRRRLWATDFGAPSSHEVIARWIAYEFVIHLLHYRRLVAGEETTNNNTNGKIKLRRSSWSFVREMSPLFPGR